MKKNGKRAKNLELLPPLDKKDNQIFQVIVETPKGSRNKFAYDPDLGTFQLKKVLPEGMSFPHSFGFVPSTKAEDGDPADVLILMDEPAYPGCMIPCRLIGVIEGEQTQDGKKTRNDRFVAVSVQSHTHSELKDIKDLNKNFLEELESFFEQYHKMDKTTFKCIGVTGAKGSRQMLKDHFVKKAA